MGGFLWKLFWVPTVFYIYSSLLILVIRTFFWPPSKEFEEYKDYILKEKKAMITFDKKIIFPLKDSSKGIYAFIAFQDFPYNIFAFKSKVSSYIIDYDLILFLRLDCFMRNICIFWHPKSKKGIWLIRLISIPNWS